MIVEASILVGIVALGLALSFVLVAGILRSLVLARARRRREVEARWTTLLFAAMRGDVDEWPQRGRGDDELVLGIVGRLLETVEGSATDHLLAFVRRAGLHDAALRIVARGDGAARLLAASVLGRLGDLRAIGPLRRMATEEALVARTVAAQALIRINPAAGVTIVVPLLAAWEDCHAAVAVAILEPAPPDLVADAVAEQAEREHDPERRVRLVEILGSVPSRHGLVAIRTILSGREGSEEPEVVARCLHVIHEQRDPMDGPLVRPFLDHPVSFVRVQAVAALGRLRIPGDQWLLLPRLADLDWWVRYRAARALADFPGVPRAFLDLLSRVHADRYARGALGQVLSERAVGGETGAVRA